MNYVLDSDLVITLLRGIASAQLVDWVEDRRSELTISTVSVMEVRFGADRSQEPRLEHAAIDDMLETLAVTDFDRAAADHAGSIRAALRRAGTPIGPYDALIAGHVRSLGATLVTGNVEGFGRVPGLLIEDWRSIA